jgi:MEMO1 family protein
MNNGIVFGAIAPHPPLLIPAVGKQNLSRVQATVQAMRHLSQRLAECRPEALIVISPHSPLRAGSMGIARAPVLHGDFGQFGAPGVKMRLVTHQGLAAAIFQETQRQSIPIRSVSHGDSSPVLDWGVMVPLHFVYEALPQNVPVISLGFSMLSFDAHYAFGQAIQKAATATGLRVAFVASGDMSHRMSPASPYGYDPMGPVFDAAVQEAVTDYDPGVLLGINPSIIEAAGECGLRSIIVLFGALDGLVVKPEVLSYEGPFGIGYLVATLGVGGPLPEVTI